MYWRPQHNFQKSWLIEVSVIDCCVSVSVLLKNATFREKREPPWVQEQPSYPSSAWRSQHLSKNKGEIVADPRKWSHDLRTRVLLSTQKRDVICVAQERRLLVQIGELILPMLIAFILWKWLMFIYFLVKRKLLYWKAFEMHQNWRKEHCQNRYYWRICCVG
jgi:hypothetical protein